MAGVRASARGVAFFGLMLAGAGLVLALVAPVLLAGAGIGSLFDHGPGQDVLIGPVLLAAALAAGRFLPPDALLGIRWLAILPLSAIVMRAVNGNRSVR